MALKQAAAVWVQVGPDPEIKFAMANLGAGALAYLRATHLMR